MKNTRITSLLFVVVIFAMTNQLVSNPTGAPAKASGGPAESGATCSQGGCHSGTPDNVTNILTTNIPAEGYTPGTTYTLSASVTGSGKKGLMVSAQKSTGTYLGTLIAGTGSKIVFTNYLTHSAAKTTNPAAWSFQWTAPAAGSGPVTFYGAFAVTLGTTHKQSLTVQEKLNPSLPLVQSILASNITTTGAAFSDSINAHGTNCTTGFQCKQGSQNWITFIGNPSTVSSTSFQLVTGVGTGLLPGTLYSLRGFAIAGTDTLFSATIPFTTLTATGVQERNKSIQFNLFPNPASQTLFVNFNSDESSPLTILLNSIDGKTHQTLVNSSTSIGDQRYEFDITQFPEGLYLISIQTNKGTEHQKILLVH